jgi:hypothetical protein
MGVGLVPERLVGRRRPGPKAVDDVAGNLAEGKGNRDEPQEKGAAENRDEALLEEAHGKRVQRRLPVSRSAVRIESVGYLERLDPFAWWSESRAISRLQGAKIRDSKA